jgi:hypothetical protein
MVIKWQTNMIISSSNHARERQREILTVEKEKITLIPT